MSWWNQDFRHRQALLLENTTQHVRNREPVIAHVHFEPPAHPNSIRIVAPNGSEVPSQLFESDYRGSHIFSTQVVFVDDLGTSRSQYWIYYDREDVGPSDYSGIQLLTPTLADGIKRLDTGYYVLELCRGTGDGTSSGKWGIRYFEAKAQGTNLIKDCTNAIGGFYGPFFTPANGLVNPPEHTIVECLTEVEGPVYCRYRFKGKVPPGLDPNLRDKEFEIVWQFFHGIARFVRTYFVDEYATVIDQTPVSNKITVGDEFESGQGNVVLSRFGSYGGTEYRSGDPYAQILAKGVYDLLQRPDAEASEGLKRFKQIIGDDINMVSWDYFWRLFSVEEGILTDDEIRGHVKDILQEAHDAVHNSPRKNDIRTATLIDVSAEPDQTIFPIRADKTVELNPTTGYAMVWYTSSPVARYQIVQRPQSGWVNWGTNGENEFPELPTGSTISTAYGQFEDWEREAEKMESSIAVSHGSLESL